MQGSRQKKMEAFPFGQISRDSVPETRWKQRICLISGAYRWGRNRPKTESSIQVSKWIILFFSRTIQRGFHREVGSVRLLAICQLL